MDRYRFGLEATSGVCLAGRLGPTAMITHPDPAVRTAQLRRASLDTAPLDGLGETPALGRTHADGAGGDGKI
ncbi:MAG: hypothetical protein J07HX64_02741 [halophilic archaeon J07HX64]|nr:MAG: hypothetical protein J07HX64_02741 [halophilic archaeon J07HX64]